MTRQFYRPDEVAEILKVNKRTLYRLMENGDLGYINVGGQRRITDKELDDFVERNVGDPLDVKNCDKL